MTKNKGWLRRLRSLAVYLLLIVGIMATVDWWRSGNVPTSVPVEHMQLQSLDGASHDLAALSKDKPVIVYFWGTWCPVCPTTSPTVDWFNDRYSVISIAMASGNNQRIQAYLDQQDYSFATINDNNTAIADHWGVQVTPTIAIVIDSQVVSVTTGVTTPVGLQLRIWLNELLA